MKNIFILTFILSFQITFGQNIEYARGIVETLCSKEFAGRGYVNDGNQKAANFIKAEYKRLGLQHFNGDFYQALGFPVVYYPSKVELSVDDVELSPGTEFMVNAGCPKVSGRFKILYIDSASIDNSSEFTKLESKAGNKFIFFDHLKNTKFTHPERFKLVSNNAIKAKGIITRDLEKFTWSVHPEWADYPVVQIKKGRFSHFMIELKIDIDAQYKFHNTQNIIGYFKGKTQPDSFIVFSAHYDHLGMFGESTIFPGANDNASGVAMMLDLANYFKSHPPKYSVAFIAFTGEEIGLLGSYYYTHNPLFPLNQIAILLNLDLMGTGDKGMTAVNATVFKDEFLLLQTINADSNYLVSVNARGKAQNSDHYYFTEAGVKSFFFYLMGNYHFYHDVHDSYEALTFSKYDEAFSLIRDFTLQYQK
jgi:aminopeptidase YwaD